MIAQIGHATGAIIETNEPKIAAQSTYVDQFKQFLKNDGATVILNHCFSGMKDENETRPSVAESVKSGLPEGVVVLGVKGYSFILNGKVNGRIVPRGAPSPQDGWVVF